ncbi:MAG: sulfotransferase [Bacteroidetes bacterium]|nr:sulfotransferase [Bacteroidota bacterium]
MSKKDKIPSGTSPVSGSSVRNLFKLFKGNHVEKGFRIKFILTVLVAIILEPFRWIEHLLYDRKIRDFEIKEDPIFILGHWRSGTTFLHNVLCQDPDMGYVTTYQTVYPEMLFSGRKLIKGAMQGIMPKKRPFDNMALGADLPQEEEFALTNTNSLGQSNFWHFPKRWRQYNKRLIEFEGVSKQEREQWKRGYLRVIKKALINTKKSRLISKNPPNTGRIKMLLEMFPNARFIHIYRDPINTYVSTKHLVGTLMPTLTFQKLSEEEIDANILWQYEKLIRLYEAEKSLIPPENLYEVKYEDFEKDPMPMVKEMYEQLRLPDFVTVGPLMEQYLSTLKSFKKNDYKVSKEVVDKVTEHWGFAIDKWNYDVPHHLRSEA